jgi:hypothetical protein
MVRGIRLMSLACLWLVPALLLWMAFSSDWTMVWEKVRVPSWGVSFMDIRSITSGVRTVREGGDPLIANAHDPYHRPLNYPRIWLFLFPALGITDANVWIVGLLFCALYLVCISWLMFRCDSGLGVVTLLVAGLSLAPLLSIERGNTDLLIFAFIFLGCVTANKYLEPGAFFAAAVLKVFPFAALIADGFRRPNKERTVPIVLSGLAIAVFAWQWRDLKAIRHATPMSVYLSFGTLSLRAQTAYMNWKLMAGSCAAAALIAGIAWFTRPSIEESLWNSKFGKLFSIFGAVYVFAFAIGSNWDYRLIFLVPTLPLALELTRSARHRRWGVIYIASVIAAENSFFFGVYQGIPVGDLSTFIIFAMILPIFLQQARNFLLSAGLAFQSSTGLAASHDKVA